MMGKGIFITGTDTGVGKTYVATGIARGLRRSGVDVGVMKPAETGCSSRAGRLVPGDACKLIQAADTRDSLDLVNPYRFKKPLAPFLAAELEGKNINPEKILTAYKKLSLRHSFMIVEGAGGILVPLWQNYTYLELARAFALPVVIVAKPGLGTINHTLLTISALQHSGSTISGVVVNFAQDTMAGLAEKTNPWIIEKLSGIPVWGVLSHGSRRFDSILARLK
jgi:dethiobiotin synthetase